MSEPTTAEICDCANTGFDAISTCQRVIRGRVEPPCDCECHKPTREQMCADLARAMEWDFIPSSSETALPDVGEWYTPLGKKYGDEPPDPFTSAEDSRALVLWLAEEDERWVKFYYELEDALGVIVGDLTFERVRRVMTTPLPVIAEAAWQAIQPSK